jgi:hypothetical protein
VSDGSITLAGRCRPQRDYQRRPLLGMRRPVDICIDFENTLRLCAEALNTTAFRGRAADKRRHGDSRQHSRIFVCTALASYENISYVWIRASKRAARSPSDEKPKRNL